MSDNEFYMELKKDEVLCVEGEKQNDLYILHKGKLLISVTKGTQVTALAHLNEGEFLGELSFFDGEPRSANIIATEDCKLLRIPKTATQGQMPAWLITLASHLTQNIRKVDKLISQKNIRKKNVDSIKPLSIDEQRHYFSLITSYREQNGLEES